MRVSTYNTYIYLLICKFFSEKFEEVGIFKSTHDCGDFFIALRHEMCEF